MLPKCDCCKKVVKQNGDAAVGCSYCSTWRHAKCCTPPLSPDVLQTLEKSSFLQFICDKCRDVKLTDHRGPKPTETTNDRLAEAIEKLAATLAAIEGRVTGIERKIESLSQAVPTREQVVNLVNETVDQRENRNHLVICGVEETDISDNDYLGGLFSTIGAAHCEPTEVNRMGKQSDQQRRKPRLIKVRFSRRWQRDEVLQKAKTLKDSTIYPGVFIRPSYTVREREMIADLYDQKTTCERDGGVWFIRRQGPVEEWEVVRSERTKSNGRDNIDGGQWQTVQSRRNTRISHQNITAPSTNSPTNPSLTNNKHDNR